MRICVVSTPIFPVPCKGYSGLEQVAWLTAKGLAERGHTVSLVAPEGSECPGVQIISNGKPGTWDEARSYSTYWQHLLQVDCVIDETWQKWSYILKQEGRLTAPVLGVLHAPIPTMYQQLPPIEKPCFVCISQDQANHFEALHSRQVRVAHNGIDLDLYRPMETKRSDRFLFLARFSTIKGADLCQDLATATNTNIDLLGDTTITGEPEYLRRCKERADGKQIRLLGGVPRNETIWWYSQARGFWHLNQRFREPFGLAPVEAQACGLGVLGWNYGALREVVCHGETGYLVTSMKDAENVIRDGFLDRVNRKRCQEWASQFSVERMATRYETLCEEALNLGGW